MAVLDYSTVHIIVLQEAMSALLQEDWITSKSSHRLAGVAKKPWKATDDAL